MVVHGPTLKFQEGFGKWLFSRRPTMHKGKKIDIVLQWSTKSQAFNMSEINSPKKSTISIIEIQRWYCVCMKKIKVYRYWIDVYESQCDCSEDGFEMRFAPLWRSVWSCHLLYCELWFHHQACGISSQRRLTQNRQWSTYRLWLVADSSTISSEYFICAFIAVSEKNIQILFWFL